MREFQISVNCDMILTKPLSYMEFLNLWKDATLVLTDSGGIQEETTALGIPCITLRDNTERPITISEGTNTLAGNSPSRIIEVFEKVRNGRLKEGRIPKYWDGKAARRIVDVISRL